MTANEKLKEVQSMVTEQRWQLMVALPHPAVNFLLEEVDRLKHENMLLQKRIRYYMRVHPEAKREVRTLRKELDRIRKSS